MRLRYLSDIVTHDLILVHANSMQKLSLRTYSDSDSASDPNDTRSTSDSRVYFEPNLVAWSSKKYSLLHDATQRMSTWLWHT